MRERATRGPRNLEGAKSGDWRMGNGATVVQRAAHLHPRTSCQGGPASPYRVRSFLPCQASHSFKGPQGLNGGRSQGALLFPRFSSAVSR